MTTTTMPDVTGTGATAVVLLEKPLSTNFVIRNQVASAVTALSNTSRTPARIRS